MAQKYPFCNFQIDGKVVTLIMVSESGIATPEMASRSMNAFQKKLQKADLVLVAQGVNLAPVFIGAPPFVERLRNMPLHRVSWQHFEA